MWYILLVRSLLEYRASVKLQWEKVSLSIENFVNAKSTNIFKNQRELLKIKKLPSNCFVKNVYFLGVILQKEELKFTFTRSVRSKKVYFTTSRYYLLT